MFDKCIVRLLTVLSFLFVYQSDARADSVLKASVCSVRINALTNDIKWYSSLENAKESAQGQNKLIFWVHMLGKIDGPACSAVHSVRSASLSVEPTLTMLKDNFVCGFLNIANKRYVGASGKHRPNSNAVDTSNGAGPHNLQMFVLASDGTVLMCLPGYWCSQDLAKELKLAIELNKIWQASDLSREEKEELFKQMQLAHIHDHGQVESNRSQMQGFDIEYEAKHKPNSDFFLNPNGVNPATGVVRPGNLKTVDKVMHQRMATRPFLAYDQFDVGHYIDYGKPMYDKHEQFLDSNGNIKAGAKLSRAPVIGNSPQAHPIKTQIKNSGKSFVYQAIVGGLRAAVMH